jgi:uncharacterized membrane protein YfcA
MNRIVYIFMVLSIGVAVILTSGYGFEWKFLLVTLIAFCFEFVNGATGMGFGTLSAHTLLWLNFNPVMIVQNILISELITGFTASHFHQEDKNIDFFTSRNKTATAMITIGCILGVFVGVPTAMQMQKDNLIAATGAITILCGIFIFWMLNKVREYGNKKMLGLSIVAAFNKSLTGGGFGALLTSGQVISGVEGKNAAAITAFAKGITGGFGIALYIARGSTLDTKLLVAMLIGSLTSVPLATGFIKRFDEKKVKIIIAVVTIFMGILTLLKGLHII